MYGDIMRYRMKQLREEKGFKQEDIAIQLDISRSNYALYETGKRRPDIETIAKIANIYNVTVDWLIGREKPEVFKQ